MSNLKIFLIVTIIILLIGNIFSTFKYFSIQKELESVRAEVKTQQLNEKVLDFTTLFIEEVLRAEAEVDFETRLTLENAVRNLGDEEILTQWQRFTESKTEAEAQEQVKNLLEILVNKIANP